MSRSKNILMIATYVLGMFIFPIFLSVIWISFDVIRGTPLEDINELTLTAYVNFIVYGIITIIAVLIFRRHLIEQFKKIGSPLKFIGIVLLGWLVLLALLLSSNMIVMLILGEAETAGNQQAVESIMSSYPLLMILPVVLFAPLVEEIVFRLVIMDWLKSRPWVAILVSSFLFGLIHVLGALVTLDLRGLIFILPYTAMGLPLGFIYYKTKNIWYPIGIHILQNLFAAIVMLISFAVL